MTSNTTRCVSLLIPLMLATAACRTEPATQAPQADVSLETSTVSETGFGPIVVGMTPLEARTAANGRLQLPERLGAEGCDYAAVPGLEGLEELSFMIENGRVVRVDVRARGVRTVEGAMVGDSEARIQELYPGRVTVSPHKYTDGHYLTVASRDAAGGSVQLIFETDGSRVTRFRGGLLPQVAYVEGCG